MSKRKLTYKDFKQYFSNNLPKEDKYAFEKDMMRDSFEEDAFEGLSSLSGEELDKDILEIRTKIDKRAKRTLRLIPDWYKYAASAVIIVGVGLSVFFINSRFWQDSMMREQLSEEMKIADSLLFETELSFGEDTAKSDEISTQNQEDTSENIPSDLVAVNDIVAVPQEIIVVDDAIEISDELILNDSEAEAKSDELAVNEAADFEIIEFDEEEEVIEEGEILLAEAIEKEEKAADNVQTENLEVAGQKSAQPMASRAKKSAVQELDKADSTLIIKTEAKPSNTINETEFQKFIIDNIDYTKLSAFVGEYTVEFSFTVSNSGELRNFNFTQSPDEIFNNEITRVILETGNWIPATENNQNIESQVKLTLKVEVK